MRTCEIGSSLIRDVSGSQHGEEGDEEHHFEREMGNQARAVP